MIYSRKQSIPIILLKACDYNQVNTSNRPSTLSAPALLFAGTPKGHCSNR